MNYYYIYRNFVIGLCLILTFPVLGLTAHWTTGTVGGTLGFEGLGIFISVISLLVFPAMLLLSEFRKNAFVLYIFSEIIIVLLMWIFWMTTMILVMQQRESYYPLNTCSRGLANDQIHWCNELFAIQGLTVVIFVFLLKYLVFLSIFAFINHARGVYIWKKSVKELQIKMPVIKLTHSSSEDDLESKPVKLDATDANTSVFGAPATSAAGYPPPPSQHQQAFYAQPQPTYASQTPYANAPMQYANPAPGVQSQAQINQSVAFSQRPPQPPSATQNYPRVTPGVPQI